MGEYGNTGGRTWFGDDPLHRVWHRAGTGLALT